MRFYHVVSGRRYFSLASEPRHASLASYRRCVAEAYGSLRGVTFGLSADLPAYEQPLSVREGLRPAFAGEDGSAPPVTLAELAARHCKPVVGFSALRSFRLVRASSALARSN